MVGGGGGGGGGGCLMTRSFDLIDTVLKTNTYLEVITGFAPVSFCFLFAANLVILNIQIKIVSQLRPLIIC